MRRMSKVERDMMIWNNRRALVKDEVREANGDETKMLASVDKWLTHLTEGEKLLVLSDVAQEIAYEVFAV